MRREEVSCEWEGGVVSSEGRVVSIVSGRGGGEHCEWEGEVVSSEGIVEEWNAKERDIQ